MIVAAATSARVTQRVGMHVQRSYQHNKRAEAKPNKVATENKFFTIITENNVDTKQITVVLNWQIILNALC